MIIETHAHLDFPDFQDDLPAIVDRAREAGVGRIVTIATNIASSRRCLEIAETFDDIYVAAGLHPGHVDDVYEGWERDLREIVDHPKVAAVGEAGMDFHKLWRTLGAKEPDEDLENSPAAQDLKARQEAIFRTQLEVAADKGLNVVIHQRDAWDATLKVLAPFHGRVRGVFHCFVNSPEQAQQVIAAGHLVSFTGIVTFKSAKEVMLTAKSVPAEKMMFETDSPFLAPVPYRGKRCEPAYTKHVLEKVADLKGMTPEELAKTSTATAEEFFRFRG